MKRFALIVLCSIITLVLAACGAAATPTPTQNPDQAQTAPDAAPNPPRPDAPATGDTFRPDHPSHVASTGRPQLIEFFAYT